MKATLDKDNILINIFDLLKTMEGTNKIELIDALACEDEVIKYVADQIIYGSTELGSHGSEYFGGDTLSPLQEAKRAISISANDIANREIRGLEFSLKMAKMHQNEYMNKYFELYHAGYRPDLP